MGAVLAVLFLPLQRRLERRQVSTRLASFLLTVGISILVLLPTTILIYQGAKTAVEQLQTWKETPNIVAGDWVDSLLSTPGIHRIMEWFTTWFPIGIEDLTNTLQDLVRATGIKAADSLTGLLTYLPSTALGLAVIIVSIFFFLVDGRGIMTVVRRYSIFNPRQTEILIESLAGVCRSVVLASLVSGGAQALFEGSMVFITGSHNAMLIGVLVFIFSFIPVIGSAPVTILVALHHFLMGSTAAGITLAIAALVVMTMDNFIRPWFLRGTTNLHPLLAFVAAFGGLQTLGFVGVFLGPIVAALLLATIKVITLPMTEATKVAAAVAGPETATEAEEAK